MDGTGGFPEAERYAANVTMETSRRLGNSALKRLHKTNGKATGFLRAKARTRRMQLRTGCRQTQRDAIYEFEIKAVSHVSIRLFP
jgi:hypothetical protein